jgi:hypothetical protein
MSERRVRALKLENQNSKIETAKWKPEAVKRRYLIWEVNHTIVLIDATPIDLPNETYPPEGKRQSLTSLRFQGWTPAERFLLNDGADAEVLSRMKKEHTVSGASVLTILS